MGCQKSSDFFHWHFLKTSIFETLGLIKWCPNLMMQVLVHVKITKGQIKNTCLLQSILINSVQKTPQLRSCLRNIKMTFYKIFNYRRTPLIPANLPWTGQHLLTMNLTQELTKNNELRILRPERRSSTNCNWRWVNLIAYWVNSVNWLSLETLYYALSKQFLLN